MCLDNEQIPPIQNTGTNTDSTDTGLNTDTKCLHKYWYKTQALIMIQNTGLTSLQNTVTNNDIVSIVDLNNAD